MALPMKRILQIFLRVSIKLYNSVSYTEHDLCRLSAEIDSRINENYPNYSDNSYTRTITVHAVQGVENAVLELKQGKKREKWTIFKSFY